jgi:hypothetical protein
METQDAHEHILVVGKVCHSLDILDMGVLTKLVVKTISVCTMYVLCMYRLFTRMYHYSISTNEYVLSMHQFQRSTYLWSLTRGVI